MTFDEMVELQKKSGYRKKPRHEEHRIQSAAFRWFRSQFPHMRHNLFAIPNAGRRSEREGAYMKEEGLLPGVADVALMFPNKSYHACFFEFKTKTGRQSDSQKEWQKKIIQDGFKYVVIRSVEEFVNEVYRYLNDKE